MGRSHDGQGLTERHSIPQQRSQIGPMGRSTRQTGRTFRQRAQRTNRRGLQLPHNGPSGVRESAQLRRPQRIQITCTSGSCR
ncbi:hypothetical protein OG426_43210 [Streptomyces canus]|uniref:hypothetical protein n=1 Tax=Streptomyces canus TaxID=58343 RepID=UPI00386D1D4F|nr:hypothetical protein OG426_43210 [Streptomyces canus]